jgi:signal transduction histidine kinase
MKALQISSLFFSLACLLFFSQTGLSQNKTDSLSHYVNLINEAKLNTDLSDAVLYLNVPKKSISSTHDSLMLVYQLTYVSQAQRKMGALYDSEQSAINALSLLDNMQLLDHINTYKIALYNELGLIQYNFENYTAALTYYQSSLDLNTAPKPKVILLNNIGNAYRLLGEDVKAIPYLQESYKNSLLLNDPKLTARALDNLGFSKIKTGSKDALSHLQDALKIRQLENYIPGILTSYLHLGEYYNLKKDRDKALDYALKAVDLADLSGNIDYKISALNLYVNLQDDLKIKELKKLNDGVTATNILIQNKYAAKKYNYEKHEKIATQATLELKESEIKRIDSQLEAEKEKYYRILFITVSALILILSLSLFVILRARHKKEQLAQIFNTEIRISRKIHDELANDVYYVMTKMQETSRDPKQLLDQLESIYNRTRDISKENSSIDLTVNYQELLNDLFLSYKNEEINIITRNLDTIKWNQLNKVQKKVIYRVTQELLTNMKKHSGASIVVWSFSHSGRSIVINYKDNGVGSVLNKRNGLQNVETRINSIKGSITFASEIQKGFQATITI